MSETVLLVEDEPLLREVTREDLEDLGYGTACARDANEALEILESSQSLALLMTDIRMPGPFDGHELARRARELRPGLPVIYLSGYSDNSAEPVSDAAFVRKPYRLSDIEEALVQVGLRSRK